MWKYQCQSVNILLITTENAQNDIGQQIEALLTGLMSKVNDHINDHFQKLEEKLTTLLLPCQISLPKLLKRWPTHVIDEYRDRKTCKLNLAILTKSMKCYQMPRS